MKRSSLRSLTVAAAACALVVSMVGVAGGDATQRGGTFTDDDGNIHEGFIEAIAAEGVTRGCNPPTNDRYCPSDSVTRGQIAAFLVRALGLASSSEDWFGDDDGSVFEADINALAAAGITRGCDPPANSEFCPDDPVTREQMAAFLHRALPDLEVVFPEAGDFIDVWNPAVDTGEPPTFYADIVWLAQTGVTRGCNPPANTMFCPDDPVRRDQMASFLGRALGLEPLTPPPPGPTGEFTAVFVAVRQGDAALYVGSCGEMGLIDANRFRHAEILAAMDDLGSRKLEWISVSHYDADHLGGIVDVATASGVSVGAVYDRGGDRDVKDSATYRDYYDWVTAAGIRQPVDIGDTFTLCSGAEEVTFTVVSVGTDGTAAGGVAVTEENDRGVCLHVEYGDFDLATCGDVNGTDDGSRTDVESQVAPVIGDVEVAKVNHHGSSFSSNQFYVDTLSAEVAVISVGSNSFGHPDPGVVARWDAHGDLFQTQHPNTNALIDGNIIIVTDGTTTFEATGAASGTTVTHALDEASG